MEHKITYRVSGGIVKTDDHPIAQCKCGRWMWRARQGVNLGEIDASWRDHIAAEQYPGS